MLRSPTLPFVPTAVALGHLAGYAVAHPDPADRAHALTGHGHLWLVLLAGVVSGLWGLVAAARARTDDPRSAPPWARLAQHGAFGFWSLEVLERALQSGLAGVGSEPAVWWGLAFQVAVAALLVWLARAAATVGSHLGRRAPATPSAPRHRSVVWRRDRDRVVVDAGRTAANRRRGPPLLAA